MIPSDDLFQGSHGFQSIDGFVGVKPMNAGRAKMQNKMIDYRSHGFAPRPPKYTILLVRLRRRGIGKRPRCAFGQQSA